MATREGLTTTALRFFRALADESRLKMIGVLAARECSVEELAAMLEVRPPTISHHLARLREAGLVQMRAEGTTHLYHLNTDTLRVMSREMLAPEKVLSLADTVEADAWERKVLRDFFEGERLKEIPASRKKRAVVLRWLANQFEPEQSYSEQAVNEVGERPHPDSAALRRELIGHGLLERQMGVYRRPAQAHPTPTIEREAP